MTGDGLVCEPILGCGCKFTNPLHGRARVSPVLAVPRFLIHSRTLRVVYA